MTDKKHYNSDLEKIDDIVSYFFKWATTSIVMLVLAIISVTCAIAKAIWHAYHGKPQDGDPTDNSAE
jgi:hypothetical protein